MNLSVARQTGPAEIARVGESPEIREIVKRSKVSCWPDARNFRRISTYFVGARRWRPVKWNEGSFHHTAKSSGGVPLRQNRSRDIYPSFYMLSSSSIGGRSRSRLALNQVFQLAFTRVPISKSDKSLSLSFFFFLARRVCALTLRTVIYCDGSARGQVCEKRAAKCRIFHFIRLPHPSLCGIRRSEVLR